MFLTFMCFNESLAKLWTQFYSVFILVSCFGFFLFLVFVLKNHLKLFLLKNSLTTMRTATYWQNRECLFSLFKVIEIIYTI